jgi:integrase/recombinase XerD
MAIKTATLSKSQTKKTLQNLMNQYGQARIVKELRSLGVEVTTELKIKEETKPLTLVQAYHHFLTDEFSPFIHLSESSKGSYKSDLKSFGKYHGVDLEKDQTTDVFVKDIFTPEKIKIYLDHLNKLKIATRNKKAAVLRSFISSVGRDAMSDKQIQQLFNTALAIEKPDEEPLPRAFTPSQIEYLMNLARLTRGSLRNYTIIWTLIGTGIRVDELFFQIGDVNFDEGWVKVKAKGRKNKGKVKRFMTPGAKKVLKHFIDFTYVHLKGKLTKTEYKNLYVFSDQEGTAPLSKRAVQKMIKLLINAAVDDGVIQNTVWDSDKGEEENILYSTHCFRHSFAVYALTGGMNIYVVKELLGHKSLASTEVYLNLFDDQYREAIEKHPFSKLEIDQLRTIGGIS